MPSDPAPVAGPVVASPAGPRPWYSEPETFIALTALVVSISAVAVGLYEAALQRRHDRAEVWPHLEIQTFTYPTGAAIYLENTGIGPAIVTFVDVTVDGKPAHNWPEVVTQWLGHTTPLTSNTTVVAHALRPGDRVTLMAIPQSSFPAHFWDSVGRLGVTVCYTSVFGEAWSVAAKSVGGDLIWRSVRSCPAQLRGTEF